MSSPSPRRVRWVFGFAVVVLAPLAARGAEPAAPNYPFANPPLTVYDKLNKAMLSKPDPFAEGDRAYLADFWAARTATPPKPLPPADDAAVTGHLIASGVSDPKARAAYLKKFTDLVDAAKVATAGGGTSGARADLLLRFVHKGVMSKGYALEQSSLAAVFDTGTFNCVSASCLYYLVGTRLGLKLQPVLIPGAQFVPGHAAIDLLDGKTRIELEPTSPEGYDWPKKLKQPGVVVTGPQPDRKKAVDADGFGLAGAIASNQCAALAKTRPAEAIKWGVIALVFAPTDRVAEGNVVAAVSGWGVRFHKENKFESALAVYDFARSALGAVKELEHNHFVAWVHYLDATLGAGKIEDGQKLLKRAATAFPKDKEFASLGWCVARAAERRVEKDGWAAGLGVADATLREIPNGDDALAVRAWKDSVRRRWSESLLAKGNVADSFKVISGGVAENPNSKEMLAGLSYHVFEGLSQLDSKKGTATAVAHFKELVAAFPKSKEVRDQAYLVAHRALNRLADAKKFDDALKAVAAYEPLSSDRGDALRESVYDRWGRSLAAEGKWEAAVQKYADGFALYPKSALLRDNGIATVDRWASQAREKKEWATAVQRYDTGLKHFQSPALKSNRDYCVAQLNK